MWPVRGGLNGPAFVGMMGVVRLPERYVPDLDLYHERARTNEDQQFAAVMLETAGALDMPDGEKASLAARISRRMGG